MLTIRHSILSIGLFANSNNNSRGKCTYILMFMHIHTNSIGKVLAELNIDTNNNILSSKKMAVLADQVVNNDSVNSSECR